MSVIVTRSPDEIATLRAVYLRRCKADLQDLARRLNVSDTGTKATLVEAILPKCFKLIQDG